VGAQTSEYPDVDTHQLNFLLEFLVEQLELRHLSPARRAQSGPEIQHHGFALKPGQVAVAEAHFFDPLEHAEIEVRGLRPVAAAPAAGSHCEYD